MSTTIQHTPARTVDGVELPPVGTYALDESHTHIGFTARHLVVSKTRGRFSSFRGTLAIAEDPLASSVEVEIDIASVDSRDEKRDGHLLSPDFFDVEHYPTMTYRSTGVRHGDKGRFVVDGELTVRDVTRPVELVVEFDGAVTDPWGGTRAGFTAKAEVNREDFGLTWNQVLEGGGVVVGKTVTIEIEAEAILQ
ncbi:MAG TPA: YceI family protein [Acidimicrobiia bacterium]|nr:YceI family protein [Acidimicrobiia bacterium]